MSKLTGVFSQFKDLFYIDTYEDKGRTLFGVPPLDLITGGGMPVGRVIECFGNPSSGKTTLALHAAANIQKAGGFVLLFDCEYSTDDSRLTMLGLNAGPDSIQIGHPDTIESMFTIMRQTIPNLRTALGDKVPILFIIDSIASLPSESEMKGQGQLGQQAKAFNTEFRKTMGFLAKYNIGLIGINQARTKLGVMFGNKVTTPGGDACKFYSSIRLELTTLKELKGSEVSPFGLDESADDYVGSMVKIRTVKNKTATPFRDAYCVQLYKTGYHPELSIFETCRRLEIVKSANKEWTFKGLPKVVKKDMIAFIQQHRPTIEQMLKHYYFEEIHHGPGTGATEDGEETQADD